MPITQQSANVADRANILHTDHNKAVTDIAAIIAAISDIGPGVRQTVETGKITSGVPAYLQNDTTSISIVASITEPMVATTAAGFDSTGGGVNYRKVYTANTASVWSSLTASKTLYLYLDRDASDVWTGGFSEAVPVYGTSPSVADFGADATTSAAAISGGDLSGTYPKEQAFDNNAATLWISSQTGTGVSGAAYIGQNFGSAKIVRRIKFTNSTNADQVVTSVKVQYSSNGSAWTDYATYTLSSGASTVTTITLGNTTVSAQYWRLLANDNPVGGASLAWGCCEIEMFADFPADQHWFDLNTWKMKRWDGSAWVQDDRVFVGECVTNGSSEATSLTPYAIRGEYAPGRLIASASTATTKNHNIGCDNVIAQCHQATSVGGSLTPCALTGLTGKTVSFTTAASVVEVVPVVRRAF